MENTPHVLRMILLGLAALPMLGSTMAQPSGSQLNILKERVQSRLSAVEGRFAVAFKSMQHPEHAFCLNEDVLFHAASTMKVPVMAEVFNQAKSGKFSLADSVTVRNEFKSIVDGSVYKLDMADDSEENLYGLIGRKRTIQALVHDMITASSNLATNILIEMTGTAGMANMLVSIGAKDMRVLRGVEDQKAFDKGWNNTVTARDLLVLFEKMARNELISRPASLEMIRILSAQRFDAVLPAKLPPQVKVAHKTGEITGVQHDAGIVFMPNGNQYVLVLLSDGLKNRDQAVQAMADVSEMVYGYMNAQAR